MLTQEQNDVFTRVGLGTPAGELLRRYWMPVAAARDLSEDQPTKFVRILCEDLVLFQDKSGRVGLIQDHCPHRGASLLYGRVEERGIACAYHGWLYDTRGNCLETPAEPADSNFYLTVKARAYPVRELCGLYWAYLGPEPVPDIPLYDVWVYEDASRRVSGGGKVDCNWFQIMENSVDPAHLQILHQSAGTNAASPVVNTTRGLTDDIESFDFYETPYGIMKHRVYKNGLLDEHPLIFPNILRHQGAQIRVPIDDTHTATFLVSYGRGGEDNVDDGRGAWNRRPVKEPVDALHPFTRFRMDDVGAQDRMAWETQGPVADRTVERIATSDRGIAMYRAMVKREIEKVQQGLDPMCVVRDPEQEMIDTGLDHSLREYFGRDRAPALAN